MKQRLLLGLAAFVVATGIAVCALAQARLTPFDSIPVSADSFVQDVAFSADGNTLYLTRGSASDPRQRALVMLTRNGTSWSPPVDVTFSGHWRDLEQVLTPDGRTLIFASNRPMPDRGDAIDGYFSGKVQPGRGGNLWSAHWNGHAWGTPVRLPDAINANTSTFSPAVAGDGTLYFMRSSEPGPRFHLYMSKLEDSTYRSSIAVPFGDTRYSDFDPTVAPDNSFVIFASNRPPARAGTSDLFITFNRNGEWTSPEDMGSSVNPNGDATEPRLSPDAKTLYFSSQGKLWSVDLAPWLAQRSRAER